MISLSTNIAPPALGKSLASSKVIVVSLSSKSSFNCCSIGGKKIKSTLEPAACSVALVPLAPLLATVYVF